MPAELTADVFVSVDGFAGSDGLPAFFGYDGPDLQSWIAADGAEPQTALLGRRTHDMLAAIPAAAHGPTWSALDKVVFSRTLRTGAWDNTRICAGDLIDEVRTMKADGDVPLRTVGSLSLIRQLLAGGLVDRLRLMTFPLLAGPSGREPWFAGADSADLDLVDHRVLDGRVVLLEYRPTGRDIPRG